MAKKKKRKAKNTRIAAFAAIIAIVAAGGAGTAIALNKQRGAGSEPAVSTEERSSAVQDETDVQVDLASVSVGTVNGMTGRAKTLCNYYNADTIGWINVPRTDVDYPIVLGDDNEYYLDHDFDHKSEREGAVFMDFRNTFGYGDDQQSDNLLIYGHNMARNTMFGSLRKYRQDLEFYREAPFIEIESNYKKYTYVIFALPITSGSAEAEWRFWDMEDFGDQAAFDDYVAKAREKSLVDIPVDVKYGDKLVTLCTCYSDEDNSRFLVIGRRLRPGENAATFASAFAAE